MAGELATFIRLPLRFLPFFVLILGLSTLLILVFRVSSAHRHDPVDLSVDFAIEFSFLGKQPNRARQRWQSTHQNATKQHDAFTWHTVGSMAFIADAPSAPKDAVLGVVVGHPGQGVHAVQALEFEEELFQLDISKQAALKLSWTKEDCKSPTRSPSLMMGDFILTNDPLKGSARVAMVVMVMASPLPQQANLKVRWQAHIERTPILVKVPLQAVCFLPVHPGQQVAKGGALPPVPPQVVQGKQMANKEEHKKGGSSHGLSIQGPARFAIISFANAHLQELQRLTWSTVAHYCTIHGYTAHHVTPSVKGRVPIHFSKYIEMLKLFDEGYEWIVWLDADVAITNVNITLESIVKAHSQSTTSLIIGRDPWSDRTMFENMWCPINSGAFFLRVSPWTRKVLEFVVELAAMEAERFISFPYRRRFDPGGLVDQPVLTQTLMLENQINLSPSQFDIIYRTEYHQHVSIVPQRVINSVFRKGDGYNDHPETMWKPGDWVVHVTGEKDQSARISYLNYVLSHASDPPAPTPAISDFITSPPVVVAVVDGFSHLLRSTTISPRQAQLIGTTIYHRVAEGPLNVLVWGATRIGVHAQMWAQLNPKGITTFLADPTLNDGTQPEVFRGKVHYVSSIRTSSSDRGDKDLSLATSVPCTKTCTAARADLTLLPSKKHWHSWDVIIIDDPLATESTNQMIHTASLFAFNSPNHTTDIFILNAEHRMLRRYCDAFLGTQWLYNTYACPTPNDPNCPGSYLMHWRVATGNTEKQVAEVFRTVQASWAMLPSYSRTSWRSGGHIVRNTRPHDENLDQTNYMLRGTGGGGMVPPGMICRSRSCWYATAAAEKERPSRSGQF